MATLIATWAANTAALADGSDATYLTATETNLSGVGTATDHALTDTFTGAPVAVPPEWVVLRVRALAGASGGGSIDDAAITWTLGAATATEPLTLTGAFAEYATEPITGRPAGGGWQWADFATLVAGISATFILPAGASGEMRLAELALDIYGTPEPDTVTTQGGRDEAVLEAATDGAGICVGDAATVAWDDVEPTMANIFEALRTMNIRTYTKPMRSYYLDGTPINDGGNGTVTFGTGLIYQTGVYSPGEPEFDLQAAGGAYEWAENLERFNQDPFGYIYDDPAYQKDSYFGFTNYWSVLMKPNFNQNPSTGSYCGLAVGSAGGGQGGMPTYNQVHFALRRNLGAQTWEAVVSNKWATPGNRTKIVTLSGIRAGFDVDTSWKLEILHEPQAGTVKFYVNAALVLTFTDAEHGEGDAPLAGILANAYSLSSTLLGGGPFVSTGSDPLGQLRVFFWQYTNFTWTP